MLIFQLNIHIHNHEKITHSLCYSRIARLTTTTFCVPLLLLVLLLYIFRSKWFHPNRLSSFDLWTITNAQIFYYKKKENTTTHTFNVTSIKWLEFGGFFQLLLLLQQQNLNFLLPMGPLMKRMWSFLYSFNCYDFF